MLSQRIRRFSTAAALLIALGILAASGLRHETQQRLTRQLQREFNAQPPRVEVLRRLLDGGADPRAVSSTRKNLVMTAAEINAPDLVNRALNAGLDVNDRDTFGNSALEYAINAAQDRPEPTAVVKSLLDRGADLNGITMAYGGPLFTAAANGEVDVIKLLVAAGAEVNQQDHRGYTALYHAALAGKAETVATLLTLGADPFIRAKDGRTAAEETRLSCAAHLKSLRQTKAPHQDLMAAERPCRAVLQLLH